MAMYVLIFVIYNCLTVSVKAFDIESQVNARLPEDGRLNFTELAKKYGYPAYEYDVITADGYILKLFNIPGTRGLPVLLMHGLADSADCWIIRGNKSMAITLAKYGYDLWFGNIRGNRYSRQHVGYNPDKDEAYWDFSFHENGYYDLAAIIDKVLDVTKSKKLNAIGISQGTTIFYVLCSTRPEYNKKVNVLMALASIAFLQNVPPPLSYIISISTILYDMLTSIGIRELLNDHSLINILAKVVCPIPNIGYNICMETATFPFTGYDREEVKPDFVPVIFGRFPTSVAVKTLYHFAQVSFRRTFAEFDYGVVGNKLKYKSVVPPVYNLGLVTTKVVLYIGMNDKLSTVADSDILRSKLPNMVRYIISPRPECNHIDCIWGENMNSYLFPYVIDVLQSY